MREKKSLEEKYREIEGEYTGYLKSRLPKFDTVFQCVFTGVKIY